MAVFGRGQLIENLDRYRSVAIDQRRKTIVANLVTFEVDGLRQRIKIPSGDVVTFKAIAMQGGKYSARGVGKLHFQGGEIPRHGEFPSIGVDNPEVHQ